MDLNIRLSADLKNHYNDFSKECHETRKTVIITKNGRGDTAILSLQEYRQMTAELELLRTLAEAEEDVHHGRVAVLKETFDDIRANLLSRED